MLDGNFLFEMERFMQNPRPAKYSGICIAALAVLAAMFVFTTAAAAQTENVLYSFTGINHGNGSTPQSNLIFDGTGNLYGTTVFGGQDNTLYCSGNGCGQIFELSPNGSGGWTWTDLHTFVLGTDGAESYAGLTLYGGNLYGTATIGGTSNCGTVFELTPNGSGGWNYRTIHEFDGTRGANPESGVVFDASGNLYGTTYIGGSDGYGVLFKLTPTTAGGWIETVLHNFTDGTDGGAPNSLISDALAGVLYGTTYSGGSVAHCLSYGCGVAFKFSLATNSFRTIYSFQGKADGGNPGGLTEDGSGNLYVAAAYGGDLRCNSYGCGTIFELTPSGSGWIKDAIYAFKGGSDGEFPFAGPTLDGSGNLYGTTNSGGNAGSGVLFKMAFSGGVWNESVLHTFNNKTGGGYPYSGVTARWSRESLWTDPERRHSWRLQRLTRLRRGVRSYAVVDYLCLS
jgi:uncharacterized repeat protein (TIGR03803 family)